MKMNKMVLRNTDLVKIIHLYLTSIIKDRMSEGRDTFCAFIDTQ